MKKKNAKTLIKIVREMQELRHEAYKALQQMNAEEACDAYDRVAFIAEDFLQDMADQLEDGCEPEDLDTEVLERSF